MVIEFDPEQVQKPRLRDGGGKILEQAFPPQPQRLLQRRIFGIAAFRQQLAGLCFVCGLQQPFLFFRGQQAVFHGVQPGGDRQIIGILDAGHGRPSLLYREEDRSDLFLQLFPLQPHQCIKGAVELHIPTA